MIGRNAAIAAGHPLSTAAGFESLLKGGNAFDAGVATLLVGGVVEQDLYSLGGEALVLVYPRRENKVISVVGQGWAPKGASVDWYVRQGKTLNGTGLDPAVVPGALHAALTVLERWGTMSFEQVSARAIEYAEQGFPMRPRTRRRRDQKETRKFIEQWPENRRHVAEARRLDVQAGRDDQAADARAHAEADGRGRARERGKRPRRRHRRPRAIGSYKGDIAREMVAFLQQHQAPFELERLCRVLRQGSKRRA